MYEKSENENPTIYWNFFPFFPPTIFYFLFSLESFHSFLGTFLTFLFSYPQPIRPSRLSLAYEEKTDPARNAFSKFESYVVLWRGG